MIQGQVKSKLELLPTGSLVESEHTFWNDLRHEKLLPTSTAFSDDFELKGNIPFTDYTILPFTDWAYNGKSVFFEQSKNAHYLPCLKRVSVHRSGLIRSLSHNYTSYRHRGVGRFFLEEIVLDWILQKVLIELTFSLTL